MQDRPRPLRPPEENAAVAATCSGPDSGSGEVTSKLRNPGSAETGGMDPSIGGGHALTVAGGAATDGKCVSVDVVFSCFQCPGCSVACRVAWLQNSMWNTSIMCCSSSLASAVSRVSSRRQQFMCISPKVMNSHDDPHEAASAERLGTC